MSNIQKYLKKVPQYTRYLRHLRSFIQHSTLARARNLFLVELELKLRKIELSGRPYILIIDPINICDLRCPLCPTGLRQLGRPQKTMSFDTYKIILDKLGKYAYEVSLHNWGEPFLNPDIFKMIEYTHNKNIATNLSSNFNRVTSAQIDNIISSGLEYFVISLDGTSEEVYSAYRVKGNFHRVMENLCALIKRKRELKSKTPVIEWQFIVTRHNQHQIEEAKKKAREIGVDILRFIPVGLPFDAKNKQELRKQWFPTELEYGSQNQTGYNQIQYLQKVRRSSCFYLYRSIVINPDGSVSPCCMVYDKKYDFSNILEGEIDEIWNNEFYQSARALFSKREKLTQKSTVCSRCSMFSKVW